MKPLLRIVILLSILSCLVGCQIVVQRIKPTPSPAPPPPPDTACAAVAGRLQPWLDEKLPRFEKEVAGGVAFLNTPQVTNCIEDRAFFVVRVGFERPELRVELDVLEGSLNLVYHPDDGRVCLDLLHPLSDAELSSQGIEQVGQEIKLADVQEGGKASIDSMPTETRARLDQALSKASIDGADPKTQSIGTEAAGILMDWSVDELVDRFVAGLTQLLGLCISLE
jgi:hypothetical protein